MDLFTKNTPEPGKNDIDRKRPVAKQATRSQIGFSDRLIGLIAIHSPANFKHLPTPALLNNAALMVDNSHRIGSNLPGHHRMA